MLVHICCSVDSHYFLQKLREETPNEKLIGYFYNPNIHPKEEYRARLEDVKRSCKQLNIELIEGEYDDLRWFENSRGLEESPEGGMRCEVCFDTRLEQSAKKALELNEKSFSTTLLMSPKKNLQKLNKAATKVAQAFNLEFCFYDFRKNGGTQKQFALAKDDNLYKQNYCGCHYALLKQRDSANKEAIETYSPITKQILPSSFEEKMLIYKKASLNKNYTLTKTPFLNYRLKRAYIKTGDKIINSYPLFYSHIENRSIKSRLYKKSEGIFYLKREEVFLISLKLFNTLSKTSYDTIEELLIDPPKLEKELKIRAHLTKIAYSLTPIIVVENPADIESCYLYIDSIIFSDIRESLIKIG